MSGKIRTIRYIPFLFLAFSFPAAAETREYRIAYVGDSAHMAYLGVLQGLDEANLQGQFLGQRYTLDVFPVNEALQADYSAYIAVAVAADRDTFLELTGRLAGMPVFNLALEDDDLRAACLANALHIIPSRQMKADAVAQWRQKNPDSHAVAQTWHPDFVKFAARDLNKRFLKAHNTPMDDNAWAGWAAIKMASDTIARENITTPAALLEFLKTGLVFDGQMGVELNFRPTGQLRQPMLLVDDGKIAGEAPVRGVADDLDSLGNIECAERQ